MERVSKVLLSVGLLLCLSSTGFGNRCERENIFGSTQIFYCPEAGDDADDIYCCGFNDAQYCCSIPTDDEILDFVETTLPTVIGVVAVVIVVSIVLCIVCCCCCPFCILYQRRNRGTVHNPNTGAAVMQPLAAQPQTYAPQQQPGYPVQPMAMNPPPAGYPTQPYPPPAAGYPTEQPPMYTEKQPAYNPTY